MGTRLMSASSLLQTPHPEPLSPHAESTKVEHKSRFRIIGPSYRRPTKRLASQCLPSTSALTVSPVGKLRSTSALMKPMSFEKM